MTKHNETIPQNSLTLQGGVVRYYQPVGGGRQGGGKRSDILPWMSPSSRRRFQQTLARVRWTSIDLPCWFLTLTLSPHYWQSPKVVKRALKRFRRRLETAFSGQGYLGAFYRREYGEGGNVHYHLLAIGPDIDIQALRRWVLETWTACCEYAGVSDRKTDFLRVDVTSAENTNIVSRYLAAYVSKASYLGVKTDGTGRTESSSEVPTCAINEASLSKAHTSTQNMEKWGKHWGIWGGDKIPWEDKMDVSAIQDVQETAIKVKRIVRKWLARLADVSAVRKSEKKYPMESFVPFEKRLQYARKERIVALRKKKRGEVCPDTGELQVVGLPFYEKLRIHNGGYTLILSVGVRDSLMAYLLFGSKQNGRLPQ